MALESLGQKSPIRAGERAANRNEGQHEALDSLDDAFDRAHDVIPHGVDRVQHGIQHRHFLDDALAREPLDDSFLQSRHANKDDEDPQSAEDGVTRRVE